MPSDVQTNARGTTADHWQLDADQAGPQLRNESGVLAARNDPDSAYAQLRAADPTGPNDVATKQYGDANWGTGSGISEATHEALDTLVHRLAETSYVEITRSGGQVTAVIVWETAAKLKKVRETNITRLSGQVSVIVEKQYDAAGAVISGQTLTHTITRSSGRVASIATVQT